MRNGRDPKSVAEQVHERLLAAREQKLISRDTVTVVEAWKARRGGKGPLDYCEINCRTTQWATGHVMLADLWQKVMMRYNLMK